MNELNKLEIEIKTKLQLKNDALMPGEIELLMSILPELLQALQIITEAV